MPTVAGPPKPARMGREGRFISNDGVDVRSLSFGRGFSVSLASWKLEIYGILIFILTGSPLSQQPPQTFASFSGIST